MPIDMENYVSENAGIDAPSETSMDADLGLCMPPPLKRAELSAQACHDSLLHAMRSLSRSIDEHRDSGQEPYLRHRYAEVMTALGALYAKSDELLRSLQFHANDTAGSGGDR